VLLGVVGADGTVGYISPRAPVSAAFVEKVKSGGAAEKRFRFAQACVESDCAQWTGSRCGVIDTVVAAAAAARFEQAGTALPRCGIRASCRWFAQAGARACAVCPLVITDSRDGIPRG